MKKHILFFVLLLLLIIQTKAQTSVYHPFPDSNAVWSYGSFCDQYSGNCDQYTYFCSVKYSFYVGHDTIINFIHYKILQDSVSYLGYIRQDTVQKKVFVIFAGDSVENLAYNDNWQVGDTIYAPVEDSIYGSVVSVVLRVDSILLHDGTNRKAIYTNNTTWVQGIGNLGDFFGRPNVGIGCGEGILCFKNSGNCLYTFWNNGPQINDSTIPCYFCGDTITDVKTLINIADIEISPNPATNQLTIHTSSFQNEVVTVSIMNVLGQTSPPAPLRMERGDALIDVSKLAAGIYFVQLKTENGSVVRRFVKE